MKLLLTISVLTLGLVGSARADVHWRHPGTAPHVPGGIHSVGQLRHYFETRGVHALVKMGCPEDIAVSIKDAVLACNPEPCDCSLADGWHARESLAWSACSQNESYQVAVYKTMRHYGTRHGKMIWADDQISNGVIQEFECECYEIAVLTDDVLHLASDPDICGNLTYTTYRVRTEVRERVEVREKVIVKQGPRGERGPRGYPGENGEDGAIYIVPNLNVCQTPPVGQPAVVIVRSRPGILPTALSVLGAWPRRGGDINIHSYQGQKVGVDNGNKIDIDNRSGSNSASSSSSAAGGHK